MNLLRPLRWCVLVLACGTFQAQAVPVVFSGQIDISSDGSGTYSIDFGINDTGPEATIYSLYWNGESLQDNSNNLTSLQSISASGWAFSFVHDVLTPTYGLDFSQTLDAPRASVIGFALNPPYGSVTTTQNSDTFISVLNLNPTLGYQADISATDPFAGIFVINPLSAAGAPEIDPHASFLPGLLALAGLAAARRRGSQAADAIQGKRNDQES